jgi:hypothetical protein
VDILGGQSAQYIHKHPYPKLRSYIAIGIHKEKKMMAEPTLTEQEHRKPKEFRRGGSSGGVYGLGLIGAWVYYFRRATTLRQGVEGFFKGLFWPAFLVYDLLVFLKKE